MPNSLGTISAVIFITTILVCIPPVIRYYKKESGKEWERNSKLSIVTILRGGLPACALIAIIIMLALKFLFY